MDDFDLDIDNYGLALLRSDFFEANKLFSLDSNNAKIKIIQF